MLGLDDDEPGMRQASPSDSATVAFRPCTPITDGTIAAWNPAIYEPEAAAFGGDIGPDITHDLFHAVLAHAAASACLPGD